MTVHDKFCNLLRMGADLAGYEIEYSIGNSLKRQRGHIINYEKVWGRFEIRVLRKEPSGAYYSSWFCVDEISQHFRKHITVLRIIDG